MQLVRNPRHHSTMCTSLPGVPLDYTTYDLWGEKVWGNRSKAFSQC